MKREIGKYPVESEMERNGWIIEGGREWPGGGGIRLYLFVATAPTPVLQAIQCWIVYEVHTTAPLTQKPRY